MTGRKTAWAAMFMALAFALSASAGGVSFTVNKSTVLAGQDIMVTFNKPLPKEGEKYWITIISASEPDSGWGNWKYVDAGVGSVTVTAPGAPGSYEIRLHDRYDELPNHCIARKSINVLGGNSSKLTFTLKKTTISAGEKPFVTFSSPLPKEGEKYWITVCPAGSADSEWGLWQYVDAGVSSVELKAVPSAGAYEVRLHDSYPAKNNHVVHRAPLAVK